MSDLALLNPHLEGEPFHWRAGPVGVLLVHGLTATVAEVRLLAERLHEHGFTVCGPLLPGHGTTPEDCNRTPWQAWAAACERAYQELRADCDRVFVGGESTGAVLGLYLAAQHPEMAGALAYAPAIKLRTGWFDRFRVHLFARLIDSVPKSTLNQNANWQGYKVHPLRAVRELYRLQKATRARLARIRQPILVVQGRGDTIIHPSSGQIILQGVRSQQKSLRWLEHSGHVILLEDELDLIFDWTLAFIDQAARQ